MSRRLFPTSVFLALLLAAAQGQDFFGLAAEKKVKASASASKIEVRAGERFQVRLDIEIDQGWHIYGIEDASIGIKTTVKLAKDGSFEIDGGISSDPKPEREPDRSEDIPGYDYYTGKVVFTVPVRAKSSLRPGDAKLKGSFGFQECSDSACLQPSTTEFEIALKVVEGEAPAAVERPETGELGGDGDGKPAKGGAASQPQTSSGATSVQDLGFLAFLGLAIGAGILTLLTPCVFPLVPVTISYFLKQSSDDRRHTFLLSLVYGLGIMASFTALGLGLTVVFSANAARVFAANAWVNLTIGGLFIFFGFSLLGAFELRLPPSVTNRLSFLGRGGYIGALLLGLTFAVTAFACTAPFASTVILAAVQGEYFWSALGMLIYSGTMALPFFILGLFPSLLTGLPKSGGWLNSVKVVFGFFEFAAAFKFLANVDWQWELGFLTRPLVLSIWVISAAFICLYLLQVFRMPHDTPTESTSVTRTTFALVFGAVAIYLATGLGGKPLPYIDGFLPLGERFGQWAEDVSIDEGMRLAKEQGKPLAVELTAFTCVNCRVMETTVLVDAEVMKEVNRFVSLRLYTDGTPPERAERNRKFQEERFGSVALPFYALYDSEGHLIRTYQGTAKTGEFLEFLRSVD